MKAHKLRKLAKFLDQLDDKNFNFESVVTESDENECGTVCCAIGWTPVVFPNEVCWLPHGSSLMIFHAIGFYSYENIAAELFDIPPSEAERLFTPDQQHRIYGWGDHHVCCNKATPQEVAEAIRHYIEIKGGSS